MIWFLYCSHLTFWLEVREVYLLKMKDKDTIVDISLFLKQENTEIEEKDMMERKGKGEHSERQETKDDNFTVGRERWEERKENS